jgi:hypothetical protein
MLNRLRHLLVADGQPEEGVEEGEASQTGAKSPMDVMPAPAGLKEPLPAFDDPASPIANSDSPHDTANDYMTRIQDKLNQVAIEFANGTINRAQFQELFDHYQRERRTIEVWIETAPDSDEWQQAKTEGKSLLIRKRHSAKILGYAIYQNESGMPISTIGEFELEAALVIPMLSSFRSASQEIFGGGMRSSQIDGGKWLCFVPGNYSTMIALFSTEPATNQLNSLEELHRLFETANRVLLQEPGIDADALALPHLAFMEHS